MSRFGFVVFAVVFGRAITAGAQTESLLGDQDFAGGTVLGSNALFEAPQGGEPAPAGLIHTMPFTLSWSHTVTPSAPAILTISLWDLDAGQGGPQIVSLLVNGQAQDVSVFETGPSDSTVNLYDVGISQSDLGSGVVSISLMSEAAGGNQVGLDFARLSLTVPEPAAAILVLPALMLCVLGRLRRRIAP